MYRISVMLKFHQLFNLKSFSFDSIWRWVQFELLLTAVANALYWELGNLSHTFPPRFSCLISCTHLSLSSLFLLASSPVCCISSRTSRWMHFRPIYAQYSWITAMQLPGWTWELYTSPATSLRMPSNATLTPPAASPALTLLPSLLVLNACRYWSMC